MKLLIKCEVPSFKIAMVIQGLLRTLGIVFNIKIDD
jgi:hypothetical protein